MFASTDSSMSSGVRFYKPSLTNNDRNLDPSFANLVLFTNASSNDKSQTFSERLVVGKTDQELIFFVGAFYTFFFILSFTVNGNFLLCWDLGIKPSALFVFKS